MSNDGMHHRILELELPGDTNLGVDPATGVLYFVCDSECAAIGRGALALIESLLERGDLDDGDRRALARLRSRGGLEDIVDVSTPAEPGA